MSERAELRDDDCVMFLQWALPRLRMRWPGFRKVRGQVCKRVARRMDALGLTQIDEYRDRLDADPSEWRVLDSLCRVTISRFYRDRRVFDVVGRSLLPALAADIPSSDPVVRCWSAGCASGEEAYTLGILWRLDVGRRAPGVRLRVVATDADPTLLERARVARYPSSALRELPPEWVRAAFHPVGDQFMLRPEFREGVELRRQDIRHASPEGPFYLILCRNLVFTYFEAALQARVLARIVDRLVPGGFLVLGSHENLPAGEWALEPWARAPIYRRTRSDPPPEGSGGAMSLDFPVDGHTAW